MMTEGSRIKYSQSVDRPILFHFCIQMSFRNNTSQFRVDHDTTAVFAYDDFLAHTDIQLLLRRNLVEATTTSITLNVGNTQSVTRVLTDTFESLKQTRFDSCFQVFGLFSQLFFFLLGFRNDFFQFVLLNFQVLLSFFQSSVALFDFLFLSLD